MKPLPQTVWVFVDPDGIPCLVQRSEAIKEDFGHPFERAAKFQLIEGTERRHRDAPELPGEGE